MVVRGVVPDAAACGERPPVVGRRYCAHSSVSLGSLPSPLVLSVLALPTRKFFPELVFCGLKGCSRPPDGLPRGEEFPRGPPATGNARVSAGVCAVVRVRLYAKCCGVCTLDEGTGNAKVWPLSLLGLALLIGVGVLGHVLVGLLLPLTVTHTHIHTHRKAPTHIEEERKRKCDLLVFTSYG